MNKENKEIKEQQQRILKKLIENRVELEYQKQLVLRFEDNFMSGMSQIREQLSGIKQRIEQQLAQLNELLLEFQDEVK